MHTASPSPSTALRLRSDPTPGSSSPGYVIRIAKPDGRVFYASPRKHGRSRYLVGLEEAARFRTPEAACAVEDGLRLAQAYCDCAFAVVRDDDEAQRQGEAASARRLAARFKAS